MTDCDVLVLGGGPSGIAAFKTLNPKVSVVLIEQNDHLGGLCASFEINGFVFDHAVHLSFSSIPEFKEIIADVPQFCHKPISMNYSKGKWIYHPVQNNLYPLDGEEKERIIEGFKRRPANCSPKNYYEWLIAGFGSYFTNHYPEVYTKKYWCYPSAKLSTSWCGNRMHLPSIEEVQYGAKNPKTPNVYYAKEMRYPKKGGYGSFFAMDETLPNIKLGETVLKIDLESKRVITNKDEYKYKRLVSSLPLDEITHLIDDCPKNVVLASDKLIATSMANVSIGFNKIVSLPSLWFYIYDPDVPFARAYSPSMKSINNAPKGKSSIQFEHYYVKTDDYGDKGLTASAIEFLKKSNIASEMDIEFVKVTREKYANVVFLLGMENERQTVLDYLEKAGGSYA